MNRLILIPIALVAAAAAVVAIVAGGGSDNGKSYSAAAATPAAASATSSIGTKNGPLGTYLVDAKGRTLYLFEADKPNTSNCSGACLSIWPAFGAAGKPPAVRGSALAGKLGVTAPAAGKRIVTYNGHPLYYYVGDKKPGDTTGQGLDQFGAAWYVVTPAGDKIDDD